MDRLGASRWRIIAVPSDLDPVHLEAAAHLVTASLKPILSAHGDRRVQSITRAEIERWVESWRLTGGVRGRGISHRSIVYTLGTLRRVLALGVAQGVLPRGRWGIRLRASSHHGSAPRITPR